MPDFDRKGRRRADELLSEHGFAPTAAAAGALILAGRVMVTDRSGKERKVQKAGERLDAAVRFRLKQTAAASRAFVSRAGTKLQSALDGFSISVEGRVCLDLGLSTGGFTDCLLSRGATRVHGVDVAYGVVDWRIRQDPRVVLHERTNARHLTLDTIGERVSLFVADLSFIGLSAIWPVLPPLLAKGAEGVALVKPQFELPRTRVSQGVVLAPEDQRRAVDMAMKSAERAGLRPCRSLPSPVRGRDGNQEWLLHVQVE